MVEDETDLLLFPPLRAMWSQRGQAAQVMLSGWNARRVVFGCMNLATGHRLFQVRRHQRARDFQAFLLQIRRRYRGWQVTLLLDSDSSHTAKTSQTLAAKLGIQILWLPKRAPELNPMDTPVGTREGCDQRQQAIHEHRSTGRIVHHASDQSVEQRSIEDFGCTVPSFLVEARFIKKLLRTGLGIELGRRSVGTMLL